MADTAAQAHDLMTVREVAALLRVSPYSIYRRVWSGELRSLRVGEHGPIRIPLDAVEDLVGAALVVDPRDAA